MSNADQARKLADLFANMAQSVDAYRSQHFEELSPDDRARLEDCIQKLDDSHDKFTAVAIQDTLNAIQDDLDRVVSVTTQAEQALKHLKTVAEISKVVSAAAELAMTIATADYGAIPSAIQDVVQAVQNDSTPGADKNPSSS